MKQHPFTHLGPGPYRFISYELRYYQACPGAPIQPGSTCDHCGAGIKHVYFCRTADDKLFKVGSTCVLKTQEAHTALGREIRSHKRKLDREVKQARKRINKRIEIRKCFHAFPGLHEALKTDHHIIADIRWKFNRYGSISEKQAELIFKIASDVAEREEKRAEEDTRMIDAPEGRTTITGTILTTKLQYGQYGETVKMLVKVDTDEGSWKVWGTVPGALENVWLDEDYTVKAILKGSKIQFDGKVEVSKGDTKFSFFSRPTKAQYLEPVEEKVF